MKNVISPIIFFLSFHLQAQSPWMDISSAVNDTIARVVTNFSGTTNVLALKSRAELNAGYGVGGKFRAGYIGIDGTINSSTAFESFAGSFYNLHPGSGDKFGVYAEGHGTSGNVYGLYVVSHNSLADLTAAKGEVSGTGTRYGVYAKAPIDTTRTSLAAYVGNNSLCTGNIYYISDKRLKKDIQPLSFNLKRLAKSSVFEMDSGISIEDDLRTLNEQFPGIVQAYNSSDKGQKKQNRLAVDARALIPILTASMQEQQHQIESNRERIRQLKGDILKYMAQNKKE